MLKALLAWASLATILHPSPATTQETPEPAQAAEKGARIQLSIEGTGALEVHAKWEGFADSVYGVYKRNPLLQNLAPAAATASHPMMAFRPFLPKEPVGVGDTWRVRTKDVVPILGQFHEGATHHLHSGQGIRGGWACLRAVGPTRAEIVFRLHADIQLTEGPTAFSSAWFTPAQFAGHLVIDRETRTVRSFHLYLPPRNSNVDVNVPHGIGFIADIGYIPCMELRGGTPAEPAENYTETITSKDARGRLARRFYPCTEVGWTDAPTALTRAKQSGKPIHVVILFGSLDDESC